MPGYKLKLNRQEILEEPLEYGEIFQVVSKDPLFQIYPESKETPVGILNVIENSSVTDETLNILLQPKVEIKEEPNDGD